MTTKQRKPTRAARPRRNTQAVFNDRVRRALRVVREYGDVTNQGGVVQCLLMAVADDITDHTLAGYLMDVGRTLHDIGRERGLVCDCPPKDGETIH